MEAVHNLSIYIYVVNLMDKKSSNLVTELSTLVVFVDVRKLLTP